MARGKVQLCGQLECSIVVLYYGLISFSYHLSHHLILAIEKECYNFLCTLRVINVKNVSNFGFAFTTIEEAKNRICSNTCACSKGYNQGGWNTLCGQLAEKLTMK